MTETININAGMSGEYKLCITRPDGTVHDTGWMPNIITDAGLNKLAEGVACVTHYRLGTGSTAPAATQTDLTAQIASYVLTGSSVDPGTAPNYTATLTSISAFPQGAVVGNITEMGAGWSATGATLFSRALIVNGSGNPTSITITAIDQLTIYYRLSISVPITDFTGTVNVSGTNYPYTIRRLYATIAPPIGLIASYGMKATSGAVAFGSPCTLAAITAAEPSGSVLGQSTITNAAYVANSYSLLASYTFPISIAAPIQGLSLLLGGASNPRFQVVFGTPIPKSSTNVLVLQLTYSWGRA